MPETIHPAFAAIRWAGDPPAVLTVTVRPLTAGIDKQLAARLADSTNVPVLDAALKRHCGSSSYLRMVVRGKRRFDADGVAAGRVVDAERRHAQQRLDVINDRRHRKKRRPVVVVKALGRPQAREHGVGAPAAPLGSGSRAAGRRSPSDAPKDAAPAAHLPACPCYPVHRWAVPSLGRQIADDMRAMGEWWVRGR
jgi:sRNA-binding protein